MCAENITECVSAENITGYVCVLRILLDVSVWAANITGCYVCAENITNLVRIGFAQRSSRIQMSHGRS